MGFSLKGKTQKQREADEAAAAAEAENHEPDQIAALLSMETIARDLAHSYPDSPNCDAVKSALLNASHGIAHVRKALANNARLA